MRYDLGDDGTDGKDPEQNYGLLDSEGQEKPAMRAVRHLMKSALTRKCSGLLPQPPPGVHVMRFDGSRDRLLIVWTDVPDEKTTIECVRQDLVSVTDMLGEAMELKSGSKSNVHIRIAEKAGPVYVLFRTGPPL